MTKVASVSRLAVVVTATAVMLSGCSAGSGSSGLSSESPLAENSSTVEQAVAEVRALPFTEATIDEVASIFADSGVEIVDDFTSPASAPVRLTRWQVENMAAELANEGGVSGRTLDSWAPAPKGSPPLPFLVVAWMLEGETPGARFARATYGDQDLSNAYLVRFPDGVLTLFLADATAASAASSTASPATSPAAQGLVAPDSQVPRIELMVARTNLIDAPCSTVSNFVQNAIKAVADALTIRTSGGGLFGFLAAIWNTAVRLASQFVRGLIDTLTKPVVAQLVNVFNAVAAVEQVSSVLIAWRAPLTPTPETNRFGITPEEVTGSVALQLQPHVLPVPPALKDCAASVGVDVSASAKGSVVVWRTIPTGRPDLATTTSADQSLDAAESATLHYKTGQEDEEAQDDPEHTGALGVRATIRRNDVERLRQFVSQLLFAQVPAALRTLVESLAGPILSAVTGKLAELTDVHSATQLSVTFHGEPNQCRKSKIAVGTYVGDFDKELRAAAGVTGHIAGTVTIVVDPNGSTSGSIDAVSDAKGAGTSSHGTEKLAISGTVRAPVVTLVERTVDGKDAYVPTTSSASPMRGQCPPAIRWDVGSLAPGVRALGPDGWNVVAVRTG